MPRYKRSFSAIASGLLFAASAFAADVSGIWTGTLTDRNGDPQEFSFRFTQKGEALSGKLYGENESTAISAAKVSGDQITFTVTTELNGQITTSLYVAKVDGNQMEVKRSRTDPSAKPAEPQTFMLKRLT